MRTHENEGAICIFLTALSYFVVVLLCNLAVHRVKRPRAIAVIEVRLGYLQQRTRRWLRLELVVAIISICRTTNTLVIKFGPSSGYDTYSVPTLDI